MDTATFAHPNATPRTLVVSAALVEAGAPLSDISRRLYRTKPDAQLRLFGVVLDRLESADDGRIVWSTLTEADYRDHRRPAGAFGGHHRPALAGRGSRGRDPVQGGRCGQGDAGQRPDQARRRRRDGPDRPVRRWGTCPGRRCLDRVVGRGRPAAGPGRSHPARRRAASADVARSSLGPGLDGILVVAKPAGPTSHDVVALVRRLAATKRVGHGGTLDPFACGRAAGLPRPRHADRRVPPRRPQGVPRDGLLRGVIDDRRPRGRADPRDRSGPDASRGRGGHPRPDRPDLAAATGLQRGQGRRTPRVRDGPCRRDRRTGVARGHDPRARARRRGTTRTPTARSRCST